MATAKEDLWKTLEDLTGDQFKQFKWLLQADGNDPRSIPVSRLEKADRTDTVDLMVQKYGEAEAVRRSLQVLEKISRNDLAQRLSNTRSAQRGEFENGSLPSDRPQSLQTFRVLIQSVQESLSHLTEAVEEKQKTFQKQAEQLIRKLEKEISELTKSEAELDRLLLTDTNLQFLQDVETSDLTEFSVHQPSYGKTVMASVDKLKELLDGEMKRFLSKAKLIRMQQFAVDVTLDPDTAHPNLVLSPDGKRVHCGGVKRNLPDNPERFDTAANVLGRQSFSSGRVYFEAEVREKTAWDVGVVYGSIGRKGSISSSPGGGYWAVGLRSGDTIKAASLNLDVKTPLNKVGVYVDYEVGSIIFHKVDSAEEIHRYSDCSFTEKLYPFFSPGVYHGGLNAKPLIISQSHRHPTPWTETVTPLADRNIQLYLNSRVGLRWFPKSDSMEKLSVELLNTLKNLKQDDFKQFKWFLKQDDILKGQKGIPEDELEGAERWETVDLMLRQFKGPGAKQAAINILQAIGQNNLVEQLKRFCEEQDLNPRHLRFVTEGIGEKEAELEKLREFAVDVTLDPDTAHRDLVLSSDGKQVYDTNVTKDLPMTSQRFDTCASVVGKETFSSGKFYIEVQVEGKTDWSVGIAHKSINRKGKICLSPNNGFWTIWLKDKVYEALAKPSVVLPLKSRLQKVGIFVDYDKGLVSFYNVNTADLIYSYKKCSFKKNLLLYINTSSNCNGRNSAPMIITPVVDKINKATLRSIKEFAFEVTLDPDTAHPELVLSDNGKRVHHVDVRKDVPDNPKRFSDHVSVLGKSFSHQRFYFEVLVKGKTDWTIGVATESIERKGELTLQPESGFWTICLRNGEEYEAFDKPVVRLTRRLNPERVGVFVDYDGGLVSFYNVDTTDLLYSFTGCCFAERLLPFFSPCTNIGGTNSAPLIISPVSLFD
ncbi:uncharacterized protein LOC114162056 [Xiphophorus couchianus]|uniref:uncharacterized protein LOC114162056 n=1 Tax=Xiphophorus couchianus TaxID=32473 RepID=UPI0010168AC2|nr:uncharacterized protein LOC114162056 [Xiphophorus couchianus]